MYLMHCSTSILLKFNTTGFHEVIRQFNNSLEAVIIQT
jgi:hypothetical protein